MASAAAAAAAPIEASPTSSCVGQFASTVARKDGSAFGADMSFGAQFGSQPNFGAGVVAPFAHEPRKRLPLATGTPVGAACSVFRWERETPPLPGVQESG